MLLQSVRHLLEDAVMRLMVEHEQSCRVAFDWCCCCNVVRVCGEKGGTHNRKLYWCEVGTQPAVVRLKELAHEQMFVPIKCFFLLWKRLWTWAWTGISRCCLRHISVRVSVNMHLIRYPLQHRYRAVSWVFKLCYCHYV